MLRILLVLVFGIAADLVLAEGGGRCNKPDIQSHSGRLTSHADFNKCLYPANLDCVYELYAHPEDKKSRLAFSFEEYEMPKESKPCSGSYLRFYPDKEGKQPPLQDLCNGRQLPRPFNSTTNMVRVAFKSKDFTARGFIMKWKMYRVCDPGDYQCKDGYCINPDYRCDGASGEFKDCPDKSDEEGCTQLTSCQNSDDIMCAHKLRCFPKKEKCNGKKFCRDGSDERSCPTAKCTSTELACAHKYSCFAKNHKCDGVEDCNDGSDELDCMEATCNAGQFKCAHKLMCIDRKSVCDSQPDCRDKSDEAECKPCSSTDDFRCSNKKCVAKEKRCDDKEDCGDGSDEFGCTTSCKDTEFKCGLPRCVDKSKLCNMVDDCGDNTDEEGCPYTLPGLKGLPCKLNQVFCRTEKYCIKSSLACNGVNDCGDNSDEENCAADACASSWHQCANTQYIAKSKFCDGTPHCADKSDENSCSSSG